MELRWEKSIFDETSLVAYPDGVKVATIESPFPREQIFHLIIQTFGIRCEVMKAKNIVEAKKEAEERIKSTAEDRVPFMEELLNAKWRDE